MWENYYKADLHDHVLTFNGVVLIDAKFEPDHGCFIDVVFGDDFYISGESGERIEITSRYRGLKGTRNYQVDVMVDNEVVQTFMVLNTPMGEILTPKE